MNIKNIVLMSFLGLAMLTGSVRADETDALRNAIWSNYTLNKMIGNACNVDYCEKNPSNCSCGAVSCPGQFNATESDPRRLPKTWAGSKCIFDFFNDHPTNSQTFIVQNASVFPQSVINDHKSLMGSACQSVCTRNACLKDDLEILESCMNLCCDISQEGTDYLADCYTGLPHYGNGLCGNYLQTEKFYGHKPTSKANAVMAPAPLVIRQNNKALRGNAPQAIRERGTNQNRQSRNNLQTGQPRVMPPLNQGKLPQRKAQHPGMMHVDPHHQGMLPPVNQGRTAPSVNAQHNHSGMKPVENRGRTTPPKMKPVPSHTHEVPSTVHPSMIHVNPQHPGMVPLEPHSLQAPKKP